MSPSKWENNCSAAVSLSQPFDHTIASKTCRYCSQLVVPSNRGTFVIVNSAAHAPPGERPVFSTAGSPRGDLPSPIASEQLCQPVYLPAIQYPSVGPHHHPVDGPQKKSWSRAPNCKGHRDWISNNTSVIVEHHHLLDFIIPGEHPLRVGT